MDFPQVICVNDGV
jgi:hypothetical protein